MCGISGSGKTHRALELADQGYFRVSVDALVWEKVGNNLSGLSPDEKRQLFDDCRSQVMKQMSEHLERGRKVVVDATNCRRSARDEVRRICEAANVKPVFVYCDANEEELWRRLSGRKGNGPDDLVVTREELSRYYQGFERPQPDETDFIEA